MKFSFIRAQKAQFPVGALCNVLEVSRSGFYAWSKRPLATRTTDDARLAIEIRLVHQRLRSIYGSPRIHRELRAKGHRVGKKRVERLMRADGLKGRQKRPFRHPTHEGWLYRATIIADASCITRTAAAPVKSSGRRNTSAARSVHGCIETGTG